MQARLGLGAKFIPHAAALSTDTGAAGKLAASLKGQKRRREHEERELQQNKQKLADASDEEGESRTKAHRPSLKEAYLNKVHARKLLPPTAKKVPAKEGKTTQGGIQQGRDRTGLGDRTEVGGRSPAGKMQGRAGASEVEASAEKHKHSQKVQSDTHTKPTSSITPAKAQNHRSAADAGRDLGTSAGAGGVGVAVQTSRSEDASSVPKCVWKKRGSKTRSKQKNRKRDTRPPHLKRHLEPAPSAS